MDTANAANSVTAGETAQLYNTMTLERQRIAIAEYCGWKIADESQIKERAGNAAWLLCKGPWWRNEQEKTIAVYNDLPDYLNDLNAMHEAVKTLPQNFKPRYFSCLCAVVGGAISLHGYSEATEATAAQRAEAFLRTIKKWEEAP